MEYFGLNQTVYHPIYGEGKVDEISKEICNYPIKVLFKDNNKISFTKTGRETVDLPVMLSQNPIPEIVNKPLEDNYEPFTFQEREFLRNKWIKHNEFKEEEYFIYTINRDGVLIRDNVHVDYDKLLRDYKFLDGTKCGKKI